MDQEAVKTDKEFLKFTVLRTAKIYDDVMKACVYLTDNTDVFGDASSSTLKPKTTSNDDIEEISK